MFTERSNGMGIIFVGHHTPGTEIKYSISPGDNVTLRIGAESVLIRNITLAGPQRYKGTVYGFEPSMAIEYQGLVIDQEIEFSESHVFVCQSG